MRGFDITTGLVTGHLGMASQLVARPSAGHVCDGHDDGGGWVFSEQTIGGLPYRFSAPCPCASSWATARRFNALALPPALRPAATGATSWDGRAGAAVRIDVEAVSTADRGTRGLAFCGPWNGTGKSHMAAMIAVAWVAAGRSAVWLRWGDLLRVVRRSWSATSEDQQEWRVIERLMTADLLVVDDLTACGGDRMAERLVEDIIGARAESGQTMVVTTNLIVVTDETPAEYRRHDLAAGVGGRVFSRMIRACHPLLMRGADKRMPTE